MSKKKDLIREAFRKAVFDRDGHKCRICGITEAQLGIIRANLDAHHITSRKEMPNGGYVKENGISLCPECHRCAETYPTEAIYEDLYEPRKLYQAIHSSYEEAFEASSKLRE